MRVLGAIYRLAPGRRRVQYEHLGDLPADRRQRIERGHRLLEDHANAVAAQRAHLGRRGVLYLLAVEHDPAAAERQGAFQQAHDRERGDALAAARFAHQPERFAAADLERDVLGRIVDGLPTGEGDVQAVDLEKGPGHERRVVDCGSRMSRRPSPSRLRPSTVRKIATPGKIDSHGTVLIWSRASESMLPQLGKGGRMPRPRNDSAASERIAVPMPSVAITISGPRILGSTWVNMMRKSP